MVGTTLPLWNTASNTFDFFIGLATVTLLDMAQIFKFRPHGKPMDHHNDFMKILNDSLRIKFKNKKTRITRTTFTNFHAKVTLKEEDLDMQHILFLLF